MRTAVVVGAGVFGISAAFELRRRGWEITVVDPGPVPHPDAASTDISKLVRMDYGRDPFYTDQMQRAFPTWDRWNAEWERPLYHPDGIAVLSSVPMEAGSFEGDSYRYLAERGVDLERFDATELAQRFAAWRGFVDGYYNRRAGWAESGAVVAVLVGECQRAGVQFVADACTGLVEQGSAVVGITLASGRVVLAGEVVVAAGAWTPVLLPELADRMRATGHPVLHFRPEDPQRWRMPAFSPWAADISRTGWYGFPANADGIVKVANHGPGVQVDPRGPRVVDAAWEPRFRDFLGRHLPDLADAPLAGTRLCLYCDTFDGDLWIDRHPDRPGLSVAGGGSGHGFKFAPVLGRWLADALDGAPQARFRWRSAGQEAAEHARHVPDAQ